MDRALLDLVTTLLPLIEAGALVLARPLGFILVFPVFTWLGLQGMIRTVTALVIGMPFLAVVYGDLTAAAAPLPTHFVATLAAKEFLVGIVIGVILGAPFWAAEVAGAYIDVYRGTAMATVVSPDSMSEPLITGAIFSIALVAIFLALGGMRLAIGTIYESYGIWPIFEALPNVAEPLYPLVRELLGKVFSIGLAFGAPILIAMLLGEMALAYASRFAQQINVFDATLSAKNLIFLFILPPYLYLLTTVYGEEVLDISGLMDIMSRMVAP